MSAFDALRHRLRVLLRPGAYGRELDDEARFHLELEEMQQAHASRGGGAPDDARLAARRRFGNVTRHVEARREAAGLGFLDVLSQDVRFALRSFRRTPAFTAVAVITLAIGIGANAAIFSAVHAMLIRPLPFPEPQRLMKVSLTRPPRGAAPANHDVVWSFPKFEVFRDAQRSFSDVALWTDWQFTVRTGNETDRLRGEIVGSRYLATLGVRPALGRDFLAEEDRTADVRTVLIGDALWRRAFDADPAVLGRTIRIGSTPYTIVGVLPPGFRGLSGRAELWQPLMATSSEELKQPWSHSYWAVARLKPGVRTEAAKAEVRRLGTRIDEVYPDPDVRAAHGAVARELDATRANPLVRRSLLVLLGAVGLLLLIACANVANLFLVRASARRREIAVRLAVGAGRGRLVRQLVTESTLLSLAGAAVGILVAWWGVRMLTALAPANVADMQLMSGLGAVGFEGIRLDAAALGFMAVLALATGVSFGLVPALSATRPTLLPALKEESEPPSRARELRGRNALVITEVALALVLLTGSGLMLRSLDNLMDVNPGFDANGLLTLRFSRTSAFAPESLPGTYDRIVDRIAALPGVTGVALGDCPPVSGGCNATILMRRDRPPAKDRTVLPEVGVFWITPEWPTVMRVPLLSGRLFDGRDRPGAPKSVLVSEAAARRIWPGEDPVGRPVSVGQGGFDADTAFVVGVVGDVRFISLDEAPVPDVYLPYAQSPYGRTMLFVRTSGDPARLAPVVRRAVHELVPDFPIYDVRTMDDRAAESMGYARFSTLLLMAFGALALGLATLGLYGVISFAVAQRTREIGIRMALGATAHDVVQSVVRRGALLTAAGVVIGLAAAVGATRLLRSQLYDVAPTDPPTFAAIVVLLAGAALLASWIPARRAASVQPTEALRGD